ncbi:MAG: HNH endonuclease family protein, partial [Eubacterium sp.]|nr:HNH endonuclease family protein [Eubacterium sp.]
IEDIDESIDTDNASPDTDEEAPEVLLKLEPVEIGDYVDSLKALAKHWYDTWFPSESTTLSDREKLWIDRLNRIGIGYFRPLVTVSLSKCANEDEKVKLFTAIERFIFVFFRLAYYRSNYQSSVYYGAARNLYNGETTIREIIDKLNNTIDAHIQYAIPYFIADIQKKTEVGKKEGYYAWNSLRYFLYEYEYHLWESTGVKKPSWEMFSKSEKDKVSIEHILPQTPTKWYWRNQFRQFMDNENEIAALTGSLGNLLPLAQSINSSLQNESFDEKKNPSKPGRRGYTSGSNSENEVAKEDAWDGRRIYDRCLHLLSFMEERWRFTLTKDQKETLTLVSFVNDGREVPEELPYTEESDTSNPSTEK